MELVIRYVRQAATFVRVHNLQVKKGTLLLYKPQLRVELAVVRLVS